MVYLNVRHTLVDWEDAALREVRHKAGVTGMPTVSAILSRM
jgi:hypothetical protein